MTKNKLKKLKRFWESYEKWFGENARKHVKKYDRIYNRHRKRNSK